MPEIQNPLFSALAKLNPADRALLELSLTRGLPDEEIAAVVGSPPGAVADRRRAVLDRLAATLGAADGAEEVASALRGERPAWQPPATGAPQAGDAGATQLPAAEQRPPARRAASGLARLPLLAQLLLPAALTAYLGFNAGGYFPGDTAAAAVVLALALTLRITLAEEPLGRLSAVAVLAAGALGCLAVWTLVSGSWSDAPARALIEFDRVLLYLLALLFFGSLACNRRRLEVMLWGFTAAAVSICLAGLASRILPDLVAASPNVANERLSYPVTYWNTLGLLAVLALVACFHLAAGAREPRAARVLGAAAIPALAVTLYFTFSRGAIAAGAVALVAYVLLARPRGLLPGAMATGPTAAVAVAVAYGADLLATEAPTAQAASGQAGRVALVTGLAMAGAALLRAMLLPVDARLAALRASPPVRRAAAAAAALLVGGALAAALALGAAGEADRQYDRFMSGSDIEESGDARRRLTDPGNNGRIDEWRVALKGYLGDRLKGQGAGTYQILWARERPIDFAVMDGHSLYLETLAELGIVGLVLLCAALLSLLAGLARRARGPDRALHAALFAMAVAWALHAGVDWDWEMPVVTLWVFALGGAALARGSDAPGALGRPGRLTRLVAGLGCLLLALTPALIWLSQRDLDRSARSFKRGECAGAVDSALASMEVLSVRAEPLEILAYCDVRLGRPKLALQVMRRALDRDPHNWQLHYGLAVVRAAAGLDPRPRLRSARRLNPREALLLEASQQFDTNDPQKWRRRALRARLLVQ